MAYNAVSTITVQNIIDKVRPFGDIEPIFPVVGGYVDEPALTIANDVMAAICAVNFPHKWNEINLPVFYTNSWQQDYALVNSDGTSVLNLEWLERGVAFNINQTGPPKGWVPVECGRQLPQRTAAYTGVWGGARGFIVNTFPNYSIYYGTWGQLNQGNSTLGNNPQAGSVYTSPLGPISQPPNPITQIIDGNGNYLVLTTYGAEGSASPLAAPNATPGTTVSGTGATTVWTVVDQNGTGMRIVDVPSQTGVVWQLNLVGQKIPVRFTSTSQLLTPLPDKYEPFFRAGFVAGCYAYSPFAATQAKFEKKWQLWVQSLNSLREVQDRELEENMFVPARTVMGSGVGRNTYIGPNNPFRGPRF
jgi:hypothetical protein